MGISDIIAGEIIPSICEYKVINTAEKLLPEVEKEKIIAGISTRMEALHLDKDFELPVLVDMRTPLKGENVDEEEDKDIFSLSIGLGLIIIFTTLFMLTGCSAIIKERENRVRSRIKAVGVTPFRLMAADLLSVAFAGVLITSLQFIMIYTVLREVSTEGILIVSVLMVIYAFAAAAVLIVFSSIFRKHVSFQSFMPIVVLIMGLLSGCIWSVEMMPSAISTMSAYMPSYWAHSGLLEVILYEGDVQSVVLNLVVLLIMGGTFFIPGYFIYKKQSGN
jgi:ABC-type multidrug transport system permease subunit